MLKELSRNSSPIYFGQNKKHKKSRFVAIKSTHYSTLQVCLLSIRSTLYIHTVQVSQRAYYNVQDSFLKRDLSE